MPVLSDRLYRSLVRNLGEELARLIGEEYSIVELSELYESLYAPKISPEQFMLMMGNIIGEAITGDPNTRVGMESYDNGKADFIVVKDGKLVAVFTLRFNDTLKKIDKNLS